MGSALGVTELGADFTPWTPAAYAESRAGAYDVAAESEAEALAVAGGGGDGRGGSLS